MSKGGCYELKPIQISHQEQNITFRTICYPFLPALMFPHTVTRQIM
jgi:hypothetical protein